MWVIALGKNKSLLLDPIEVDSTKAANSFRSAENLWKCLKSADMMFQLMPLAHVCCSVATKRSKKFNRPSEIMHGKIQGKNQLSNINVFFRDNNWYCNCFAINLLISAFKSTLLNHMIQPTDTLQTKIVHLFSHYKYDKMWCLFKIEQIEKLFVGTQKRQTPNSSKEISISEASIWSKTQCLTYLV